MQLRKIILNTVWFGIIPKLTIIVSVLIMPLITPFLTAADYGVVGIVTSYASIFTSVYTLGLNVHLTNSYYELKSKFNLLWGRILFILLFSGIVSAILLSCVLYFALKESLHDSVTVINIMISLPLIFGCNTFLANHLYPLRYNPKSLVLPVLFSNLIGILSSFVLIRYFELGYFGLLANGAISSVLSFLLFLKPLWITEKIYPVFERKFTRIKELLKVSLPVIPHALGFMLLTSSSRIIMDIYNVPINDIGYFSNGYGMGEYVTVITSALITALSPKIQELYRAGEFVKLRRVYILAQSFAMCAVFIFALWMPEIYKLLVKNDDLQQCSRIASLICFANIVYPLYAFLSVVAFIEKKTRKLLWLVFVPGILNILLNLVLLPVFGYETAIYTTLISYWSLLLIPLFIKFYSDFIGRMFESKLVLLVLFIIFLSLILTSNLFSSLDIAAKSVFTLSIIFLAGIIVYRRRVVLDF